MKGETKGRLANLQRCTEETPEPGKKRLHRRNKAGVCLDCGDVSHRATLIKKLTAKWTCPNCRSEIAFYLRRMLSGVGCDAGQPTATHDRG